jgi:hypothetical protein
MPARLMATAAAQQTWQRQRATAPAWPCCCGQAAEAAVAAVAGSEAELQHEQSAGSPCNGLVCCNVHLADVNPLEEAGPTRLPHAAGRLPRVD